MLTGKQKRYLRGLANRLDAKFQIGKETPSEGFFQMLIAALEAHELIKVSLLQNAGIAPKEAGEMLAEKTGAELVQVIGKVIVLYRRSSKEAKIVLP